MHKHYVDAAELLAEHAGSQSTVWFFDPPEPPSTFGRGKPREFESLMEGLEAIREDRAEKRYYDLVIYPQGEDEIALPTHITIADMLAAIGGKR